MDRRDSTGMPSYRSPSSLGAERLVADAETRPALRRLLMTVPALAGALALAATLAIHLWRPGFRLVDPSLHSSLEAVGGVTAVAMAVFLLARRWDEDSDSYFVLALGFLGMGLLDLFHSITTPGHGFVLLHSAASLVGGGWFAATWLPRRAARAVAGARLWGPTGVVTGSVVFAAWAILARWTLPVMVSQGRFTTTAEIVNVFAGVLFMAAGARLLVAFRASGLWETYLFASVSVLLGLAGLLFPYSPVWGGGWWLWHFVRLIAFLIVMGFLLLGYGRSVADLRAQVAERRQAEQALRETTDYLEKLLDHANAPIIVWDTAFRITRFNNAFQELTGYSADEVVGQELAMLFPEDGRAESLEKIKATLAGEFWESVEIPILRKDGAIRIALWNSANVHGEDGRLMATIAQGGDITERKRVEDELSSMNRTLSALYGVQRGVTQSLDLRKRLHAAIGAVCEGLGLEAAAIYLLEPDGETLVMRAHKGLSRGFANSTRRVQGGEGVSGKALQLGRPVVVQLDEYPSERLAPVVANEGLRTFASTPLISAGETLGALTLGTQRARVFSAEDLELLATIGKQLGTAVHNARLHEAVTQELAERRQAEEALRASEERYRYLVEQAADGIFVTDADGRYVDVNASGAAMLGYGREEILGMRISDLVSPDDMDDTPLRLDELRQGKTLLTERLMLRKDGARLPVEISARMLPDGRLQAIVRDVTERKLAEEAAALQAKIADIFLSVPDDEMYDDVLEVLLDVMQSRFGVFGCIDVHGALVVPSMTRHIWSDCEVPEKTHVFPREDWGDSSWPRAIRERKANYTNELSTKVPKGHVPILRHISLPILYQGEVIGLFQVANKEADYDDADVRRLEAVAEYIAPILGARLRRDRAEDELRETTDYLEKLLDHANAPIIVWDTAFRVTRFNNAFQELTGYSADEVVGQELAMLFPEAGQAESLQKIEATLAGEFWESVEIPILRKDGGIRIALWNSANVYAEDGRLQATIAQGADITVRKLAEEGLRETVDALEKSNAELERFAYVASHDLQEPLRTVASYLQLLEKRHGDRLDGDAKDFIDYAVDGAKRMQTLINDLLAYSRVATRGEPLEPVDLEQVLGHVLRGLAAATQESGAVVTHDRLPWVMGDESQLAQVLQNLIENAIKFRTDRPPKVHVAAGSEDGKVVVSVSDNGIGIDPEYFDRVFIIFQRLHSRGDYPGTGIGLAVAKRIVERHGGRMWVRSEKRNGAVLFFTLMPASVSKEGIVE